MARDLAAGLTPGDDMARNELDQGDHRVGYAWDTKIREPYPAMLRRDEHGVELVVPFDANDEALRRRYLGDHIRWGDDPDMTRHDYSLPESFWFADAHGFVSLVGARRGGVTPIAGGTTTVAECRIRIRYVVLCLSPDADFTRINGLSTRIEGLARWYGRRAVTHDLHDRERRADEVTLTVRLRHELPLARRLNLRLLAGPDWNIPGEPGVTSIAEACWVRTVVDRPRGWAEHLDLHLAVHELLELSSWHQLGFERISAMHARDPERVLSGKPIGNRWSDVVASQLPSVKPASRPDFMFDFDDIGPVGFRTWLALRKNFDRGIRAMTFSIRHRDTSLDGLLSDCGIGLENIGYQLAVERGQGGRRGHDQHLRDVARQVDDLLPFSGAKWARDSARLYNDIKHPDRSAEPSAQEMHDMLVKNRLVFRVWVARRLGVPDAAIQKHMWRLERG